MENSLEAGPARSGIWRMVWPPDAARGTHGSSRSSGERRRTRKTRGNCERARVKFGGLKKPSNAIDCKVCQLSLDHMRFPLDRLGTASVLSHPLPLAHISY